MGYSSPDRFPYNQVHPREGKKVGKEELFDYLERVGSLLPNFPRGVTEDWLFRHSQYAVGHYDWLGFERLRFEKQTWDTERLLSDVKARKPEWVTGWRNGIMTGKHLRESKLGKYMICQGTWPQPPIILDNSLGYIRHPHGETIHARHLIEGHHRLGYLHALNDNEEWTAQPTHDVWIATHG